MGDNTSNWIIVVITFAVVFVISLFVVGAALLLIGGEDLAMGNVAVIPVKGFIATEPSSELFGAATASSTEIINNIEKAEENPNVEGIIFEINSGGGGAVASDEIVSAIKEIEKPKIAWIREAGASGAYWVASACDEIVANRMSVTGSVGVISSYLDFSGLLDDYNVTYQRLVAGNKKDIGTPFKELTDEEREILEQKLDTIHQIFIDDVAANRGLSQEQVEEVSSGLFYFGVEAKELGLVDVMGGKQEALDIMKNMTGLSDINLIEYKKKPSFWDAFTVFKNFDISRPDFVSNQGVVLE